MTGSRTDILVLGLGNIGAAAGKPVMEGKGILFKSFADIDVFDLEVGSEDPEDVIRFCQLLEPTVGGINLEDIKAPECFVIEQRLRELMDIPVFHDDQHGTAIIATAGLINALDLTGRRLQDIRLVVNGAGAAGIAQFMPGTAVTYGLDDPFDAEAAIDAEAHLMADLLRQFGSAELALAAYNAGPAPVAACECVPAIPETQAYVARIVGLMGGAGAIAAAPALEVRLVE